MVTQYNKTDLVKFGNYLLKLVNEGMKEPDASGDYNVTHADIENWHVERSARIIEKWNSITEEDVPECKREIFRELKPSIDALLK